MKKTVSIFFSLVLILSLALPAFAEENAEGVPELPYALDYSDASNWAYFAEGEDKPADLFFVCPTVDTRSYANAVDLNDKLKANFVSAIDAELGVYSDVCRVYAPYYRQMSINAYELSESEFNHAERNALIDVCAAFQYYLLNENDGRPIILAGFSQGAQMCIELVREFFGNSRARNALSDRLIAVYAIGWRLTEEDVAACPQLVPAEGEDDIGCIVCYECEDGSVQGSIIIPEGVRTYSINPLNWRTDGTEAESSLNLGAVFAAGGEPVPGLCGAYINEERGSLTITGVSTADYPKVLDIFPDGCFHIYDVMFFHENLRANVKLRTERFLEGSASNRTYVPKLAAADVPFIAIAVLLIAAGVVLAVINRRKSN